MGKRHEQERAFRAARVEAATKKKGEPFSFLAGSFLDNCIEVEKSVFVGEPGELFDNWDRIARWCSTVRGGFFHARRDGVSWSCGSSGAVLMSEAGYTELCTARGVLQRFRPERASEKIPRTVQGVCRELLVRLHDLSMGSPLVQEIGREHTHLVDDDKWCYMRIKPGTYRDMTMHDASGYYWELASRIPTPEVLIPAGSSRIRWGSSRGEIAKGWRDLMESVGSFKGIRNTLIGCMGAGLRKKAAWCKGIETDLPTRFNWFTPAGLLVVRMGWEITQEAALEVDSVFSVSDCVISSRGSLDYPRAWRSRGLPVGVKGSGDTEIFSSTSYRIGEIESIPYLAGNRKSSEPILCDQPPLVKYCDMVF